jgi:dTDP-4-amino-4,6-dideoxygalactose transaminase
MSDLSREPIPFAYPLIGPEEEEAVLRVLRSGWLTTARETLAFEAEFAAFLGRGGRANAAARGGELRALAVNSATSGLHLAMEACGVGPGDVVLTSPYTFTSTAEVVRYLGADVAFVDVGEDSFNIDPDALEATIDRLEEGLPAYPPRPGEAGDGFGPSGRPRLVAPVHFAGLPCDMDRIIVIAREHDLRVVEDAAHSFPSYDERLGCAGTIGDVGVFSFYATKTITTGEGGMVVTADPELAERISIMRSHGIDRAVWNRYTDKKASWRYAVVEAGYKYNLPDILGALGREQLKRAEAMLGMRRAIAERYDAAFSGDDRFILPPTGPADARHLYPLRLSGGLGARDALFAALQDEGIGVSVHFIPLHTMPFYERRYGLRPDDFPRALDHFNAEISLPIWQGMRNDQIGRVAAAVLALAPSLSPAGVLG